MGRAVPNVFLLSKATGLMMVSLIQQSLRDVRTKKMPPRTKVLRSVCPSGTDHSPMQQSPNVPPGRACNLLRNSWLKEYE
jgi:hypothetical protein